MERSEGGACKAGASASHQECPCRPENSAGPALCRAVGPRRGMEPRCSRGRVAKATATTPPSNPNPNPPPQPVTEVPRELKVTATRKKAGPKKPEPKPTAAAQPAAGKSKKKIAASVKTAATRGNLRSPRSPSPPSMCGADSSALHIHLPPPHRDSPPAGCVEDRYSLRGRIWLHAQGEQYGVKPYASPAGMLT